MARHRTEFYSKGDDFNEGDEEWREEFDYVMNDSFEGIDWLANNMDWDDVKPHAIQMPSANTNYEDEFVNSEKSIISE